MARGKSDASEETRMADSWQLTYCSLIIILVAIFMMIMSYSTVEGKKMSGFLRQYERGDVRAKNIRGRNVSEKNVPGKNAQGTTGRNETGMANLTEAQIESARESLKRIVSGRVADDQAAVTRTRSGLKIAFKDSVFFTPEALKIRDEARPLLDDLTSLIQETSFAVGIAGYGGGGSTADGVFRSPWELTASRANLLLRYLSGQGRIPARRLAAAGFGQARPSGSGDGPDNGESSGRIEFFLEIPSI